MAFVVEDGTGLSDATSFASVAELKAYLDDRGRDRSSFSDTQIQQALIRASDYIETRWRVRFKGRRLSADQALSFPRIGLYDEEHRLVEGVPERLKRSSIEYAFRALSSELIPDPEVHKSGLRIRGQRTKVGPIEEETEFQQDDRQLLRAYPAADRLLIGYVVAGTRVVRA